MRHKAKKQKVLMLSSVASMIDQFNMPNIYLIQDMGYEVHVACNFREGNTCDAAHIQIFQRRLQREGIICHQWDCPRNICAVGKCLKAYIQLFRLIEKYSYSMIHCHSPIGGALARIVAHIKRIPVIYTAHGFHFYKGAPVKNWLLYYPVEKLLAYWTDVLITINKEDYVFAKQNLKTGKIYRIPGVGIDVSRFAYKNQKQCDIFREKYRIPKNDVLLLSVGELNEGKNHRIVLDALARMKGENVCCLICGMGKLHSWLLSYAKKLGIEQQVCLPGYVEDIEKAYMAADIFVFPSKREGMPMALMEAMAAGLPAIASNIRGNVDLIDNRGGQLFRLEDWDGFVSAVAEFTNWLKLSPERIEGMGKYNQNKIKKFDVFYVKARMRKIYVELMNTDK